MTAACHDPVNLRTLDKSGNNLHATFGNGATPTTYPTKLATRGYYLDGGDYLDVGLAPLLDFGSTGTVVAFVKPIGIPTTYRCIVAKQDWTTGRNGYSLFANFPVSTRVDIATLITVNAVSVTSPDIDSSQAHFIASRWTGSFIHMYFDGYQGSTPQTINPTSVGWTFKIGTSPSAPNYYFKGNIYFVGAWNYALSELQLRDLEQRLRRQLNDV